MNGNQREEDGGDAFERRLAGFQRAPLPESWRDEMISTALPGAVAEGRPRWLKIFRFRPVEKFLSGGLAAAWLVILGLTAATPPDERQNKEAMARAQLEGSLEPLMLAARIRGGVLGN